MINSIQNIAIAIGLCAIAFFGYYLYTQNDQTVTTVADRNSELASQQYVQQIRMLQMIDFDTELFADSDFQQLQS